MSYGSIPLSLLTSAGGEGAEVVYALRNNSTLAREILKNIGEAGQKTRKYYQRRLPEDTSKDYYFIQRLTGQTEPVLVEYGFIDNQQDLQKLQNNLTDYGEGVVKAVTEYLGYTYNLPITQKESTYTVKAGDNLYSIARKFNTTVDNLKKINNLTSNTISIGQVLKLKNIEENPNQNTNGTYIVQKGDSLYKIANKYGVTINDIIDLNKLPTTVLSVNQKLLIPIKQKQEDINNKSQIQYKVQKGDTLYSIAKKFNTTVNNIKQLNNLTSNLLSIGQNLIISKSL